MDADIERSNKAEALSIIGQILPLLDRAEQSFKSARNWGFVDIFGGGFFVDLIKHSHLNAAGNVMNQINYLLHDLQQVLRGLTIPTDYSMNDSSFATVADFLFDGILADTYMQSKIMTSLDQVRELHRRLLILQNHLQS